MDHTSEITARVDSPGHITAYRPRAGESSPVSRRSRARIAFVIDNMRIGGTELNAVRTAERLDRDRFDLRVVCLSGPGPLSDRYAAAGIKIDYLGLRSFYGPSMLRSGWSFVKLLRSERIDVVHAHDIYSNIFTAVWAKRGGARALITSRRWAYALQNRKLAVGGRLAVMRSTAVLANSASVAGLVASEVPTARDRIRTITNFVDDEAFGVPSAEERERCRRAWNVPADAVVFGCVARFDPFKDHGTLLRAFAALRRREPRAHLVLIGDGAIRPELESLARELQVDPAVHFMGEQRSRANLHHGFDVSVLSSITEGFPNSIVEAMAAGNPVIATAVGGTIDAVVDGETGLLVPAEASDALADAMRLLACDPERRRALGRAAERRARECYSASKVIASLEDLYLHLAGGSAA